MQNRDLIVVGVSAGGVEALQVPAAGLNPDIPASILIVMHMSPSGPSLMPDILGRAGPLVVVEAQNQMPLEPGKIYIAPPDHHLLTGRILPAGPG